jgi:hypothetical protein
MHTGYDLNGSSFPAKSYRDTKSVMGSRHCARNPGKALLKRFDLPQGHLLLPIA